MKKIVWINPDGSVQVSHPDVSKKKNDETEDEFYQRMVERWKVLAPQLSGLEVHIVDESDMPKGKIDRDEWVFDNGKVKVDQAKVSTKQAKQAVIQALLDKLNITKEEASLLRKMV